MENDLQTEKTGGKALRLALAALLAALAAGAVAVWLLRRYKMYWDCRDQTGDCCCRTGGPPQEPPATTGLDKTLGLEQQEEAWDRDSGAV